jgi:hypothetical protein
MAAASGDRRSVGVAMVALGATAGARGVLWRANRAGKLFTEGIQCKFFCHSKTLLC